jgi:hypothetical protein
LGLPFLVSGHYAEAEDYARASLRELATFGPYAEENLRKAQELLRIIEKKLSGDAPGSQKRTSSLEG